ncbi:MAG TPA: bifunctional 4-hydroxy-2-oxoglutarate aldolase/2-dehydro-3-deoxy-phosphogluconate aldolase [Mycobacteriales bacterium]|nr:bifunctional 4-hydroxy-2-oxoglutarate aldolase/2-dehydro-3-deoxy-phosphogluconate aldolase [Mycobacteriales bacterium]
MSAVLARLGEVGILPVAVLSDAAQAAPLGEALVAGGLPCVEVTFRTDAAEEAIREAARNPDLLVGAGTVLRPDQVHRAVAAGARFVVTPGFSLAVVTACRDAGIPVVPGVSTATEIQMALDAGVDAVKFFPAEASGGVAALKALSAPYAGVRFVPTGGISAANARNYLGLPSVLAVGGSWMVAPALVDAGAYDEIRRLTAEAASLRSRV